MVWVKIFQDIKYLLTIIVNCILTVKCQDRGSSSRTKGRQSEQNADAKVKKLRERKRKQKLKPKIMSSRTLEDIICIAE